MSACTHTHKHARVHVAAKHFHSCLPDIYACLELLLASFQDQYLQHDTEFHQQRRGLGHFLLGSCKFLVDSPAN